MSPWPAASGQERGAATVAVAAGCAVTTVLGVVAVMLASVAVAGARARTAADLGALAGATAQVQVLRGVSAGQDACAIASEVVRRNKTGGVCCRQRCQRHRPCGRGPSGRGKPTGHSAGPCWAGTLWLTGRAPFPLSAIAMERHGLGYRHRVMKTSHVARLALSLTLLVAGCGSATSGPGAVSPTGDTAVTNDDAADSGGSDGLLADTTGDAPFFIDEVNVQVAESHPVQIFLEVKGNAPTPGHAVAYTVEHAGDRIAVHITTQSNSEVSAAVLQPHEFVIPLGPADLPVTVDVNDGEFSETIEP